MPFDTAYYFNDDLEHVYGTQHGSVPFTKEDIENIKIPSLEDANEAVD